MNILEQFVGNTYKLLVPCFSLFNKLRRTFLAIQHLIIFICSIRGSFCGHIHSDFAYRGNRTGLRARASLLLETSKFRDV